MVMSPPSLFARSPFSEEEDAGCQAAMAGRPRDGAAPVAQTRGARGFTLIELLVAISVMALIAILSWRGLDGMVRAQESTRQRADEMLVLQAALGQWGTDLDALMPVANTTPLDLSLIHI